jgi:hypothetical protein
VGLIARFFEEKGIPTVSAYLQEEMVESVPAPRMLHVKWPFGHPYGETSQPALQGMVIRRLLQRAKEAEEFGDLDQPDWPWRRTDPDLPREWLESLND